MVGKDSYLGCINALNSLEFDGDAKISEAIVPSSVGYGDGFSIIISDFLTDDDYERAIDRIVDARRDAICVQILSREEMNPQMRGKMHLFDVESSSKFFRKKIDQNVILAYKEALKYVVDRIRNYCEAREARYVFVPAYSPVADVFFGTLADTEVVS